MADVSPPKVECFFRLIVRYSFPLLLCPAPALAQDLTVQSSLPPDLSFWGMVTNADWIVKAVLAGLACASIVTWTVGLAKGVALLTAGRRTRAGLRALQSAGSLDRAANAAPDRSVCMGMVHAATTELRVSEGLDKDGVKERVAWVLERQVANAGRALGRGAGVLATIGATAPFVGLFGTVWGIMNAFVGIARSQTTNLAVVAPGIAEALLATAIGLVAAIPAVVIYNLFARAMAGQKALLADAVAEVMRLMSRDLDRGKPARPRAAAAAE